MSNAYERRTRFILLNCRHKVEIAEPVPEVEAEQYCIRCGQFKRVSAHLVNYRASCKTRCTYGRNFGDDREKAFVFAKKHIQQHPKHIIILRRDSELVAEITNMEDRLFNSHEDIRNSAKEGAELLKEAFPGTTVLYEGQFPF